MNKLKESPEIADHSSAIFGRNATEYLRHCIAKYLRHLFQNYFRTALRVWGRWRSDIAMYAIFNL